MSDNLVAPVDVNGILCSLLSTLFLGRKDARVSCVDTTTGRLLLVLWVSKPKLTSIHWVVPRHQLPMPERLEEIREEAQLFLSLN